MANNYQAFGDLLAPPGMVSFEKFKNRDQFHEYEGFQIGDFLYCVLFEAEATSSRWREFKIVIREVQRCHVLYGNEYVYMKYLSMDTLRLIEQEVEKHWNDVMPYDFFEDGEDCPVNDDTKMY